MGHFYEKCLRPMLFRLDTEHAHELAVDGLALLGRLPPVCRLLEALNGAPQSRPVQCFGLNFPNRVGLAAGFDKNARAWPAAAAMGFGHVEIGTVTMLRQPGNDRPRLFRFPKQEAVINRMGFNNDGAEAVAARLAKQAKLGPRRIPLGINLGKSKVASLDQAVSDYLGSFARLAEYADYLVLNVSSPNTPDLRKLQDEERLRALLGAVSAANADRAQVTGKPRTPLLLKIAPDLTYNQIETVLEVIEEFALDGVIATNTTLARPEPFAGVGQAGGLSGAPLRLRSTQIVNFIARATGGKLPIIAVGGIMDSAGAAEKLDAGASLVQLYTGLIYRGPFFAADLSRDLVDRR
jgi:dihydroorotate dehydrogenase